MEAFILIIFFLFISIILSLSFFKYINNRKLDQLKLKLFFAEIQNLPQIRNFVYNVLKNACATEGVFFYEVPDIIINKECNCESDRSIGLYSYMENKTLKELHELTKHNLIDWSELRNQYDSY
jgi:hypothetical protein